MTQTITPEIPRAYQGADFKNPKELEVGQQVLDCLLGRRILATIVKRYKYSVQISYVDAQGKIRTDGRALHHLRRV
jgi:hypothetical protein